MFFSHLKYCFEIIKGATPKLEWLPFASRWVALQIQPSVQELETAGLAEIFFIHDIEKAFRVGGVLEGFRQDDCDIAVLVQQEVLIDDKAVQGHAFVFVCLFAQAGENLHTLLLTVLVDDCLDAHPAVDIAQGDCHGDVLHLAFICSRSFCKCHINLICHSSNLLTSISLFRIRSLFLPRDLRYEQYVIIIIDFSTCFNT